MSPSMDQASTASLPRLSDASKKKLERMIATINGWPESDLNDYLEDYPDKAKAVVQTLKHLANPLADYPVDQHFLKEYNDIIIAFDDPKKLSPNMHYLTLTNDEEVYLKELMKIKFDQLANQTMIKFKIDPNSLATPSAGSQPSREPIRPLALEDQWWNRKTPEQKRQIQDRYDNLNEAQQNHLRQRMEYTYHGRLYRDDDDFVRYYQMAMIDAELRYLSMRLTLDLTELTVRLIAASGKAAFQFGSAYASHFSKFSMPGGKNDSKDSNDGKAILAAAGFLAFGAVAIVGCIYGIKKLYNSARNLVHWRKPLKSIARILGIMAGGVAGTFLGAVLGAELAAAIPAMALATGITLGIVCGAALCAGVGALAAKYLCKAISYYFNQDALCPTNPGKWQLSTRQIQTLTAQGMNIDTVNQEIRTIKREKDSLGIEGSMFWTAARQRKNALNIRLNDVKGESNFIRQYPPRYDFFTPCSSTRSFQTSGMNYRPSRMAY